MRKRKPVVANKYHREIMWQFLHSPDLKPPLLDRVESLGSLFYAVRSRGLRPASPTGKLWEHVDELVDAGRINATRHHTGWMTYSPSESLAMAVAANAVQSPYDLFTPNEDPAWAIMKLYVEPLGAR